MDDVRDSLRVSWRVSAKVDGRNVQLWDISTTGVRVWGIETACGERHKIEIPGPDGMQQFEVETVWASGVMAGMKFLFGSGEERSAIWDLRTLVARGKI